MCVSDKINVVCCPLLSSNGNSMRVMGKNGSFFFKGMEGTTVFYCWQNRNCSLLLIRVQWKFVLDNVLLQHFKQVLQLFIHKAFFTLRKKIQ